MITNSQGGEGLRVEMKECHKSPVSSTIRGYFGWIGMNSWRFGCRKSTRRQKMKNVDDHEMSLLTLIVGRLSWV